MKVLFNNLYLIEQIFPEDIFTNFRNSAFSLEG